MLSPLEEFDVTVDAKDSSEPKSGRQPPPGAYMPMDRRQGFAANEVLPDRSKGAALFVDISGFTLLTANLLQALGPQRGAEEVLGKINPVYKALIGRLHQYRGSVISFAGDAITCWLDGDDGRRAVACALDMQQLMAGLSPAPAVDSAEESMAIKAAVAAGEGRRFLVGSPSIQMIDVLAGGALDRMAAAEKEARKGEVIVGEEVIKVLGQKARVAAWREHEATGQLFAVVDKLDAAIKITPWAVLPENALSQSQVKTWLLPPVYERLQNNLPFLSELRPAVALFLRFEGLDYDDDEAAGDKLNAYVCWVQAVLARYEAFVLQLTTGDKGSYLYAAFGAPLSHDDDPQRAVMAALELRSLPARLDFITAVQIGVSQGRMRVGAYGSESRRTYGVIGNETNVAARLMSRAEPGQILLSKHVANAVGQNVRFRSLGNFHVAGLPEPLPVFEALGKRAAAAQRPFPPLVGREDVFAQLQRYLSAAGTGRGQIVRLQGPAGIGKSRLAAEFCQHAQSQDWQTAVGAADGMIQTAPYQPWRQLLRDLLGLGAVSAGGRETAVSATEQIEQLAALLEAHNPDWLLRLPLLGNLLGWSIPDNETTAVLDPQSRQEMLFGLVVEIIQTWAQTRPLLLLLEDVHWLDESSAALTLALARAIHTAPVLLLLTQRFPTSTGETILPDLDRLPTHHRLSLHDLSPADTAALLRQRLRGPISPLALALILAQAQGNPFFIGELADALRETEQLERREDGAWVLSSSLFNSLRDAGCLTQADGAWQLAEKALLTAVPLPDTVHRTVLARLDHLPGGQRTTLKIASVIGRTFDLTLLADAHPERPSVATLQQAIQALIERDFIYAESSQRSTYAFKHNITHEVTYDTLLFKQRRQLHRAVAGWFERTLGDESLVQLTLDSPLSPHYPVLVHHWRHAENWERECVYAGLAGEQAAAQYANEEAARYLSRALALIAEGDGDGRYKLLSAREAVYDRLGLREAQEKELADLAALTASLDDHAKQAQVNLRRAFYARAISQHPQALALIEQAIAFAKSAEDITVEIQSYQLWGSILWQQGEYRLARLKQEQALNLAQTTGDQAQAAQSLYNLGVVYYHEANFVTAQANFQEAQDIYQELDNQRGLVSCLIMSGSIKNRAGQYTAAQEKYERALTLCRAIGWRPGETFILSNLGNNYFDLGDYETAQRRHEQISLLCQALGDQEGEAVSQDTLGLTAQRLGDGAAAQVYYQKALTIQQDIGDRYGEAFTLTHWGYMLVDLGDWETAQTRFNQALALRRELGEEALAQDDLVGLAYVALAQNDLTAALAYAEDVLAWIEIRGVEGIEFPVQVYLICYRVLRAATSPSRAQTVLRQGYSLLQQRAGAIQDDHLRRQFLENVPFNREIIAAWEQMQSGSTS